MFYLKDGELKKKISYPGYNFTHAGSNLLSCLYRNNEGSITCIDKKTFEIVKEVKVSNRIVALVAVNDQIWGAYQDKMITVWDMKSFDVIAEFDSIHSDKINHLCFVPKKNGESEVWSSSQDRSVHVWNAKV